MKRTPSQALFATAWTLKVDRVTAEVVGEMERAGIPHVLLKGPALREWLYEDALRMYTDTDLLVPPHALTQVVSTLGELGFADYSRGIPGDRPLHAFTFVRSTDRAHVDVHTTLVGVTAPPETVWRVASSDTEMLSVGGRDVRVPSRRLLALHAALHAAQHGIREPRPVEDLKRALAIADVEEWRGASALARLLGAEGPFAVGLGIVPEGARVRAFLELDAVEADAITRLRVTTPPHVARGIEWLATRPGLKAKISFVIVKLFPPPRFMRVWTSLARRGRIGLALAYPWRLLWLLWHAPAGFRAWLKVRR